MVLVRILTRKTHTLLSLFLNFPTTIQELGNSNKMGLKFNRA
jgi:hypothetical protein